MKLDHAFLDVPDRPRFFALLIVMMLELMVMGPLERYVAKPETLPATVVACRHSTNLFEFGSMAQYNVMLTNYENVYWIGPVAHSAETNVTNVIWIGSTNREPYENHFQKR